ncbi:MAG: family transposase, partial [Pseudomonadota bacterium]
EMQVDFGEGAPTRVPGSDRYRKPRLFVATLRYSRRSFRRVVWSSGQQVWAELHEQAWRYFGGSCRYVVLDNLKEGVLKPDLYEPELNPVYAASQDDFFFTTHRFEIQDLMFSVNSRPLFTQSLCLLQYQLHRSISHIRRVLVLAQHTLDHQTQASAHALAL